jgi:hypothetical protein
MHILNAELHFLFHKKVCWLQHRKNAKTVAILSLKLSIKGENPGIYA